MDNKRFDTAEFAIPGDSVKLFTKEMQLEKGQDNQMTIGKGLEHQTTIHTTHYNRSSFNGVKLTSGE